jgi:hypothetical protein
MTKSILTFTLSLLLFLSVKSQNLTELSGTWKISKFQYGNHPNNNERNTPFIKYKSYTPTHFIVTEIDSASGITTTSIFGTYEIKDSVYTETIMHVNRESAVMIGKTFSFKLKFDDENTMTSAGSFNGMTTFELWKRVPAHNKPVTPLFPEPRYPLYVLANGDEKTRLEAVKDRTILSLIPQHTISAVEILKDEKATSQYGDAGKNGVIIISILPAHRDAVDKILKDAGSIKIR